MNQYTGFKEIVNFAGIFLINQLKSPRFARHNFCTFNLYIKILFDYITAYFL